MQMTGRLSTEFPWLTIAKYFEKVDSTQARVLQFLPKTGDGAVFVLAESQSKGIGRNGRTWVSPPGGTWFTLALPMKNLTLNQVAPFSMVAALLLTNTLREVHNLACDLKWPNDVQYEGKKIAGILLNTTTKFKNPWLLIGVGINVNNDLPSELNKEATTLKHIRKQSQGRSRLVEALLGHFWTAWQDFDRTGFGPYQKAVADRLTGVGKAVKIAVGNKTVQGTMVGVDPQGGLMLKSKANTQTVHAGEIVGQPA